MGPSKMQAKTPGMFSLNSLAYWLNASTSHLAAVPEIASLMFFFPGDLLQFVCYKFGAKKINRLR